MTNQKKQYVLKPGVHQFAPRSAAVHHNGNISDEEAEWYLAKYPHIRPLFKKLPAVDSKKTADGQQL